MYTITTCQIQRQTPGPLVQTRTVKNSLVLQAQKNQQNSLSQKLSQGFIALSAATLLGVSQVQADSLEDKQKDLPDLKNFPGESFPKKAPSEFAVNEQRAESGQSTNIQKSLDQSVQGSKARKEQEKKQVKGQAPFAFPNPFGMILRPQYISEVADAQDVQLLAQVAKDDVDQEEENFKRENPIKVGSENEYRPTKSDTSKNPNENKAGQNPAEYLLKKVTG